MSSPLYVGMGAPYVVRVVVPASADFAPLAVALSPNVTLEVTKPSGARVVWPASVLNATALALTVQHALALEDLDERGRYLVWARFALLTGGFLRTEVGRLPTVLAADQWSSPTDVY